MTDSYLREISYKMAAIFIVFGQNVEQKRLHVVVESFVVEEELGEEAEILTVDLVRITIYFEY